MNRIQKRTEEALSKQIQTPLKLDDMPFAKLDQQEVLSSAEKKIKRERSKHTIYLTKETDDLFTELFIAHLRAIGRGVEKSDIVEEAITLLYKSKTKHINDLL